MPDEFRYRALPFDDPACERILVGRPRRVSMGRAAALARTGLGAAPPATEHEPGLLGALPSANPGGRSVPAALPDRPFLELPAIVPPWSKVV
jgi:hypothetical protein